MIEIKVNGNKIFTKETQLDNYIFSIKKNIEGIIVAYNSEVIQKKEWNSINLKNGDVIDIFHFVGGG